MCNAQRQQQWLKQVKTFLGIKQLSTKNDKKNLLEAVKIAVGSVKDGSKWESELIWKA